MKEPYGEGVASHIGPESCGGGSNAAAEALTGVRAGQVLSREMLLFQGADEVGQLEGNI
jgi:RNA-directed DNA polymerase